MGDRDAEVIRRAMRGSSCGGKSFATLLFLCALGAPETADGPEA